MNTPVSRSRRWARILAASSLLAITFVGCSRGLGYEMGTIRGRVTHHEGRPLTDATIHFLAPTIGWELVADLDSDGKYVVADPVRVGSYRVQVTPRSPPPPAPHAAAGEFRQPPRTNPDIPKKARTYASSGLTVMIKKGVNDFNVDLAD